MAAMGAISVEPQEGKALEFPVGGRHLTDGLADLHLAANALHGSLDAERLAPSDKAAFVTAIVAHVRTGFHKAIATPAIDNARYGAR
jgi:hypothetical protein